MASVSSRGRSPHSPYDFDPTSDTDESWQYIDYSSGGSNAASIGFLPSPASGSLNEYAIVGHVAPSPPAVSPLSPLYLDQPAFPNTTFAEQAAAFTATSAPGTSDTHFMPNMQDGAAFLTPEEQDFLLNQEQLGRAPLKNAPKTLC
jgi:hypothetical protein